MRLFGFIFLLLFFGLPIALFAFLVFRGIKGTKADEWEGEVIDKLYKTKTSYEGGRKKVSDFYTIVFKTNKGERKLAVTSGEFEGWKVGDKARKVKGKLGIERCNI